VRRRHVPTVRRSAAPRAVRWLRGAGGGRVRRTGRPVGPVRLAVAGRRWPSAWRPWRLDGVDESAPVVAADHFPPRRPGRGSRRPARGSRLAGTGEGLGRCTRLIRQHTGCTRRWRQPDDLQTRLQVQVDGAHGGGLAGTSGRDEEAVPVATAELSRSVALTVGQVADGHVGRGESSLDGVWVDARAIGDGTARATAWAAFACA